MRWFAQKKKGAFCNSHCVERLIAPSFHSWACFTEITSTVEVFSLAARGSEHVADMKSFNPPSNCIRTVALQSSSYRPNTGTEKSSNSLEITQLLGGPSRIAAQASVPESVAGPLLKGCFLLTLLFSSWTVSPWAPGPHLFIYCCTQCRPLSGTQEAFVEWWRIFSYLYLY